MVEESGVLLETGPPEFTLQGQVRNGAPRVRVHSEKWKRSVALRKDERGGGKDRQRDERVSGNGSFPHSCLPPLPGMLACGMFPGKAASKARRGHSLSLPHAPPRCL